MCDILGIIGNNNVIEELVTGLLTIQHRGQDAAGAVTYNKRFNLKKGKGLVQLEELSLWQRSQKG